MGLFFSKKKNKPAVIERVNKPSGAEDVERAVESGQRDMIALIKAEQEISNPLMGAESIKPKSVAKTYGTKYNSVKGVQLASSKVVDVRSYKKPEPLPEVKEKTDLEKELEKIDREASEAEQEESSSFFDDILKSIEEGSAKEELEEEFTPIQEIAPPKEVEVVPKKPKSKPASTSVAKTPKKKKSIDIDIISGDFGGSDII